MHPVLCPIRTLKLILDEERARIYEMTLAQNEELSLATALNPMLIVVITGALTVEDTERKIHWIACCFLLLGDKSYDYENQ